MDVVDDLAKKSRIHDEQFGQFHGGSDTNLTRIVSLEDGHCTVLHRGS